MARKIRTHPHPPHPNHYILINSAENDPMAIVDSIFLGIPFQVLRMLIFPHPITKLQRKLLLENGKAEKFTAYEMKHFRI